jgi:hypothetical protein
MQRGKLIVLLAVLGIGLGVAYFRLPLSISNQSVPSADPLLKAPDGNQPGALLMTPSGAPSGTPAAPVVSASTLTPADQQKMKALDEIFTSKNDNDPRIDTELKNFTPEMKAALVSKYTRIPSEHRNEKGTVAFLIGREINSKADVDFLKGILMEKPCLSLGDCNQPPAPHTGADDHYEATNETTARYPQLVSIRALNHRYEELMQDPKANAGLIQQIIEAFKEAQNSPDPKIADEAKASLKQIENQP